MDALQVSGITFTTPEVADIIGRTVYKTIAYVRRGIVKPSIQDAEGHGSRRLWSYLDVIRLAMICHLEDLGLTVPVMRVIGSEMHDRWMEKPASWIIATSPIEINLVEAALLGWEVTACQVTDKDIELMILRRWEGVMDLEWLSSPHISISMKYLHWCVETIMKEHVD